jgi:hypothetical protein
MTLLQIGVAVAKELASIHQVAVGDQEQTLRPLRSRPRKIALRFWNGYWTSAGPRAWDKFSPMGLGSHARPDSHDSVRLVGVELQKDPRLHRGLP